MMPNPFRNISLNMRATGPASVVCVWMISILLLGLFGQGELARSAITALEVAGGMILIAIASKIDQ
jgi:small neutral amino acid transporter SnatA (MarC family)